MLLMLSFCYISHIIIIQAHSEKVSVVWMKRDISGLSHKDITN